jgi:hypothetical protein
MPPITLKERQQINHQLKTLGFGGLEDRNLLLQIATLYRTHEAFRGLLMSTAPAERRIAYDALRPHLRFVAKPLDVYEREVKERAEREQWDVWNGSAYPDKFKVGEIETDEYKLERLATEAIEQAAHEKAGGHLELVCTRCTIVQYFPASTRKEAMKAAHGAGWRWDERNGRKRTYCPDHVPGRATMTIACTGEKPDFMNPGETLACGKKERLRVWDEQDGYAMARRLGWEITDAATKCPGCAVKRVLVQ